MGWSGISYWLSVAMAGLVVGLLLPAAAPAGMPAASDDSGLRVYGGVEYLFLERADPSDDTLWTTEPPARTPLFDADDFDFDFEHGVQARAGAFVGRFGGEVSGFWTSDAFDRTSFNGAPSCCEIDTAPNTSFGLGPMVSQNVRYLAQLHGVEGNALLEVLPGLVALGGVRWIDLDESVRFESLGFFEINTWKTENRMIGPQVGGRVELAQLLGHESSPWSVAGDFRAAALFNEANAHFKNARGGSNPFGDDRENDVGVGIQSSLTVGYELVDGVVLQVGYQVLWLSSVATATAQIGGTPDFGVSGEIGVDVRHDAVLYHGGTVGVTIALP